MKCILFSAFIKPSLEVMVYEEALKELSNLYCSVKMCSILLKTPGLEFWEKIPKTTPVGSLEFLLNTEFC